MDNIPTWIAITSSIIFGLVVALITQLFIVPWQKRKIAKQLRTRDPVKFNFEDSVGKYQGLDLLFLYTLNKIEFKESSPSGSPKKNRRPLSLVSDGKQLPAIAEITELVSLTDNSPKTFKLSPYNIQQNNGGENYKINPEIIKKAEDLLGKASLDNTDLTITSLNFIDEQQKNGGVVTTSMITNAKNNLQDYFKRNDNTQLVKSPLLDNVESNKWVQVLNKINDTSFNSFL